MFPLRQPRSLHVLRHPPHFEQRKVQAVDIFVIRQRRQHLLDRTHHRRCRGGGRDGQAFVTSISIGNEGTYEAQQLIGLVKGEELGGVVDGIEGAGYEINVGGGEGVAVVEGRDNAGGESRGESEMGINEAEEGVSAGKGVGKGEATMGVDGGQGGGEEGPAERGRGSGLTDLHRRNRGGGVRWRGEQEEEENEKCEEGDGV